MSSILEENIERFLVEEIEKIGGQAYKFNSSKRGMPDRMILLPGGRIIFVETKAPKGKPRPLQHKRIKDLRKLGFEVRVIDTKIGVKQFVKEATL